MKAINENEQVLALLRTHLAGMHESSPPGSVYALDLSGLSVPEVSFYAARNKETLLGIGALKNIGHDAGEIKSMHTDAAHTRKGALGHHNPPVDRVNITWRWAGVASNRVIDHTAPNII